MEYPLQPAKSTEQLYSSIRGCVVSAQQKIYASVNSAMVAAYWEIGRRIFDACGENDRADYGKNLLRYLSDRLTGEFGKGFDETNLRKMRQFYLSNSRHTVSRIELVSLPAADARNG